MFGLQVLSYITLLKVAAVGLLVGILQLAIYWGLNWATERTGGTLDSPYIAPTLMIVSVVFAHFLGLVALIRFAVLRPLLVILAAVATLWGTWNWASDYTWWLQLGFMGLFFAIAYAYYSWVNRLLVFPVALAVTVVSVLLARVIFISL